MSGRALSSRGLWIVRIARAWPQSSRGAPWIVRSVEAGTDLLTPSPTWVTVVDHLRMRRAQALLRSRP